uniref:Uncharacterized protein n=1 Tax=Pararge aegeria TaxID=116150 RepID=S4P531_9NEOP
MVALDFCFPFRGTIQSPVRTSIFLIAFLNGNVKHRNETLLVRDLHNVKSANPLSGLYQMIRRQKVPVIVRSSE